VKLEFAPEAAAELYEAADTYERQREGRGERFRRAIEATLDRISEAPGSFPAMLTVGRRAVVLRFPYAVIFRVADDSVTILAFAHGRRRPGYWLARARR
jgi:plasmid stabilization system protein ParE